MILSNRPQNPPNPSSLSVRILRRILRPVLTLILVLAAVFNPANDGEAGRKSRSGRWTATDLQLFNPNLQLSTASVEWITDAGVLQTSLAVTLPLNSSRYYTIEASGLVPATFVGGVEVVSPTQELYGMVTHFDKGASAAAFERGNAHYEIRDGVENSLQLDAPLVVKNATQRTNVSILNPYGNGTITVTIDLFTTGGTLYGSVSQIIVGNALLEFDALFDFGLLPSFTGWARITSNKPIAAYLSIYDGDVQDGYMAMPMASGAQSSPQSSASTQSTQLLNVLGIFPNTRPTNDLTAVRAVYLINSGTTPVNVQIGSVPLLGDLLSTLLGPKQQLLLTLPALNLLTQIFVSSDQSVNAVLALYDINTLLLDPANVRGFTVYPMQKLSGAGLMQLQMAGPTLMAAETNHCAVAPTVYTGYQTWRSTLKVLNPITSTGVITATFFPALGLSSVTTPLVLTKSLPYSTSVAIDFDPSGLPGTVPAGSVYLEANVPFVGDVTSLRPDTTDGIMSYRTEPLTCIRPVAAPAATSTPTATPIPSISTATTTPTPPTPNPSAATNTPTSTPLATPSSTPTATQAATSPSSSTGTATATATATITRPTPGGPTSTQHAAFLPALQH